MNVQVRPSRAATRSVLVSASAPDIMTNDNYERWQVDNRPTSGRREREILGTASQSEIFPRTASVRIAGRNKAKGTREGLKANLNRQRKGLRNNHRTELTHRMHKYMRGKS